MSSEKNQNRIDDFLLGRADAQQRREFEEEVTRNAELSNELADTNLALAAIELAEDQALKARLRKLEAGLATTKKEAAVTSLPQQEAKVVKMQPQARNNRRWYAIAATLLLLLAVGWWALQPGTTDYGQLAMSSFEPYENIAFTIDRGSEDNPEKAAYLAYEDGDYPAAVAAFRELDPTAVRRFYFGQALLATEAYAEAEPIFAELARTKDFNLSQEAAYYQAVALVGQEKVTEAKVLLKEIMTDSTHPLFAEAEDLLESL